MSETDAELVARTRSGDSAAFDSLMRRHFRMAFLIAYAQLNERADAEDVCQDAFFRCWQRIAECRDPDRVGAWIASVVRNSAHNRREFLSLRRTEPVDAATTAPATSRTDALAERRELREQHQAALSHLTSAQREIVILHDYEGWNHAEIASRLDVSPTMSRRHLSDARQKLREIMGSVPISGADDD